MFICLLSRLISSNCSCKLRLMPFGASEYACPPYSSRYINYTAIMLIIIAGTGALSVSLTHH